MSEREHGVVGITRDGKQCGSRRWDDATKGQMLGERMTDLVVRLVWVQVTMTKLAAGSKFTPFSAVSPRQTRAPVALCSMRDDGTARGATAA